MTLNSSGSPNYVDATYNKLVAMGYVLKMAGDDAEVVTQTDIDNYLLATNGGASVGDASREIFAALQTGRIDTNFVNQNDGVTEVFSANQLVDLIANNPTGLNCRLMSDFDMSGISYSSQNVSNMQFDGNGHSVTGLNKALFGEVSSSTIQNLVVEGNISETTSKKGILANILSDSTITNVSASGDVSGLHQIGGLAGYASSTAISNCSFTGTVSGQARIGGLVGRVSSSTISNCSTDVTINGVQSCGGLIGTSNSVNVTNSFSNANIYISDEDNLTTLSDSGGFMGTTEGTVIIQNCGATGSIVDSTSHVGVCCGFVYLGATEYVNSKIENSYSSVDIISNTINSGFVCIYGVGQAEISNCNYTGNITSDAEDNTGFARITGSSSTLSVTNCYSSETDYNFTNTAGVTSISSPNTITVNCVPPDINTTCDLNNSGADAARALFDRMHANGYKLLEEDDPRVTHGDDPVWLKNAINEGMIYLYKPDTKQDLHETSVSIATGLREVPDETMLRKAEAKYEADMRKIDLKDRKFDTDLAALDAERNAIKQEIDTLKTVAKDNVERTFKLFS